MRELRSGFLALVLSFASVGPSAAGFIFTTLDVPGAASTRAFGINGAGQIVGSFGAGNSTHGFLYSGGGFTTFDVPGATGTRASGINGSGQIVGSFSAGNSTHGFVYSGGVFSTIAVPGRQFTVANGINDLGQIVGEGVNATPFFPFLPPTVSVSLFHYSSGIFNIFHSSTYLFSDPDVAAGVDNQGNIVGTLRANFPLITDGFLFNSGVYTRLDVPGASSTFANGVNDAGNIVGYYQDAKGFTRGFLATPTQVVPEPSTLSLLGLATLSLIGLSRRRRV